VVMMGSFGAPPWSPNRMVAGTPWRYKKLKAGGGAAIDFGVHRFNYLRYVCGEIEEVCGIVRTLEKEMFTFDTQGKVTDRVTNEVDDMFLAALRFASGVLGDTFFCWAGHGEPFAMPGGGTIWGDAGSLSGNKITLDDGRTRKVDQLFADEATPDVKERLFPLGMTDGFALELYDFLQAIEHKKQPETSGQDGLRDLAVAYSVIESSAANRWLAVDDVMSGQVDSYQRDINEYYGL